MLQKLLSFTLIISCACFFAQTNRINTSTAEHQLLEGSKISLVPPSGFTKADHFSGFQQISSNSSVMVIEIPGPYAETSKAMTYEGLKTQNIILEKSEDLNINGLPAIFATASQKAYGNTYSKYMLIMGTEKETIIINGLFPQGDKKTGEEIKKSILSVFYQSEKITDPSAALDFTVNASGTNFKSAKSISNTMVFTRDGNMPTRSADKSTFIISKSFSNLEISDQKEFCLQRLQQSPLKIIKIKSVIEVTRDGLSGYSIQALAENKSGQNENIVQTILFDGGLYYIFFGSANDQTTDSLQDMEKIFGTFSRK